MELTPAMRGLITRTALAFPVGPPRRRYMADTITALSLGQRQAQQLFGWGRDTIRKALHEHRTTRPTIASTTRSNAGGAS